MREPLDYWLKVSMVGIFSQSIPTIDPPIRPAPRAPSAPAPLIVPGIANPPPPLQSPPSGPPSPRPHKALWPCSQYPQRNGPTTLCGGFLVPSPRETGSTVFGCAKIALTTASNSQCLPPIRTRMFTNIYEYLPIRGEPVIPNSSEYLRVFMNSGDEGFGDFADLVCQFVGFL